MKLHKLYIVALMIGTTCFAQGQSFELNHKVIKNDGVVGGEYTVLLQIRGNQDFHLGYSNLRLEYDNNALKYKSMKATNFSQGINGMSYGIANTVVNLNYPTAERNTLSYNIMLNIANAGSIVTAAPNWTDIGEIKFKITDIQKSPSLTFRGPEGTSANTVVFLDDNLSKITGTVSSINIEYLNPDWEITPWFNNDKLIIKLLGNDIPDIVDIDVLNITGQLLLHNTSTTLNGIISLPQHFTSGTYIIQVSDQFGNRNTVKALNID